MTGDSNDETNFPRKLLIVKQVSRPCRAFANDWLANIKFSTILNSEIRRNYSSINLGDSDSGITSSKNGSKKDAQFLAKSAANYFVNSMINNLNKTFTTSEGSGIILTNNEIKDIKVVQSLENRGILSTGTTEKVMKQKVVFLGSLMRLGLPFMKNVLTPLAEKCYL